MTDIDEAPDSARTRLLDELALERYAPVLRRPPKHHQHARQIPATERPTRKPTGTGWPE